MAAVTGGGRYHLARWEWLEPSLDGGIGWYRVQGSDLLSDHTPTHDALGVNLGGGLDVPVYQDVVLLGVDVRWHHAFVPGGANGGTALLNLGLNFD